MVEPKSFNDAEQIGQKFKSDIPVIINLQQADAELSKRLIDFSSGLTYGLEGGIQRVAEKVFLLSPHNVEVSAEDKRWLREKGFFNQF
jgi:cell division inhibitor SepF